MKNIIYILLITLGWMSCSNAVESTPSSINLTISEVKTFRIDKRLVRTILYNRVDLPYFELELIKAPKRALIKKIAVNSISAEFQQRRVMMDFAKSAGVDIENIRAEKKSILFEVGYTADEHTAPYIYSTCRIDVANDTFSTPTCKILKWGNEEIAPQLQ